MGERVTQVTDGVWRISLAPRGALNAYLIDDVLLDAGLRRHAPMILAALGDRTVRAHAITHAHVDHVGGSRRIVDALDVPLWAPRDDAPAVEAGLAVVADSPVRRLMRRAARFEAVAVSRRLEEGDELADGFVAVETPGHSPGHLAFWREHDRVLIVGDVMSSIHLPSLRAGFAVPPPPVTPDPAANRAAARRLAALEPRLMLFGHGPPSTDTKQFQAFVTALPA